MRGRRKVLFGHVDRVPFPCARGALHQVPVVAEEHVEVAHVPLDRVRGPRAFDAAGDGVIALAAAVAAEPAEALRFDWRTFRLGPDMSCGTGAVGLAEGVASGNERDGLFVVHGHAREGLADIAGRSDRARHAVRPFRIHVDQTHLHCGKGVLEFTVAGVAFVGQPLAFAAPVDFIFRFPDVLAAAREAEGLEAHRLQRAVARQDQEIGPGEAPAVLLLDRPQQASRLVQVRVIGPAIEGGKPLAAGACAAAAVADAVGARAVPGHANEEPAIVAVIRRPPVLRVGHQRIEVLLDGLQVELLELLRIVEVLAQRIAEGRVQMQNVDVQLVRPPVTVGRAAAEHIFLCPGRGRGLAYFTHPVGSFCRVYGWTALRGILTHSCAGNQDTARKNRAGG